MAAIQGYLMRYKTQPERAAFEVASWVEEEMMNRETSEHNEAEKTIDQTNKLEESFGGMHHNAEAFNEEG